MRIFFVTFSCMVLVAVHAQSQSHTKPGLNRGVLITLKISKAGDGYNVFIKNITVAEGIKNGIQPKAGKPNNDWLACLLFDTLIITDPLQTRYEYPNEDGTIGSKIVQLKEKEVLLRCAYDPGMKYLQIIKPATDTKMKILARANLPEFKTDGLNPR
jgi:hypothetical protein